MLSRITWIKRFCRKNRKLKYGSLFVLAFLDDGFHTVAELEGGKRTMLNPIQWIMLIITDISRSFVFINWQHFKVVWLSPVWLTGNHLTTLSKRKFTKHSTVQYIKLSEKKSGIWNKVRCSPLWLYSGHQDGFTSQSGKCYIWFCAGWFSTFIVLLWKFSVQQRVKNTLHQL